MAKLTIGVTKSILGMNRWKEKHSRAPFDRLGIQLLFRRKTAEGSVDGRKVLRMGSIVVVTRIAKLLSRRAFMNNKQSQRTRRDSVPSDRGWRMKYHECKFRLPEFS